MCVYYMCVGVIVCFLQPFSPDGQYIAAGSADGSVFVWEVASARRNTRESLPFSVFCLTSSIGAHH